MDGRTAGRGEDSPPRQSETNHTLHATANTTLTLRAQPCGQHLVAHTSSKQHTTTYTLCIC